LSKSSLPRASLPMFAVFPQFSLRAPAPTQRDCCYLMRIRAIANSFTASARLKIFYFQQNSEIGRELISELLQLNAGPGLAVGIGAAFLE
jgi:hypothetical protein